MFIKNLYFALRHLAGNLLYSLINIVGLGIGLACCLLILLYVRFESSYDSSWQNSDRIVRVSREYYPLDGARARVPASANGPIAPALLEDYPAQVEAAARVLGGGVFVEIEQQAFTERGLRFADQSLVDIFDFTWLAGDRATALAAPGTVVLTESLARKYFGTVDVVGQTIRALQRVDLQITGVIADLPRNTHLDLSGMISLQTIIAFDPTSVQNWNGSTDFHTYVLLRSTDAADYLRGQVADFLGRHIAPEAAQGSTLVFTPIADIHLYSDRDEEWLPLGDSGTVRTFVGIAFAILAIACINFMAIATARSTRRAKEVGMRKALGATRPQLIVQFLSESMLTVLLALAVAVALMELLLPAFSAFIGVPGTSLRLLGFEAWTLLALLLVAVSVMAGAWPAFFLASFQPASVLRGNVNQKGQWLRNALVVCQFAIAITLVVATLVMQAQRNFVRDFELGFDREGIVVLRTSELTGFGTQWPALKAALLDNAAIEDVSASHYLPFGFNDNQLELKLRGTSVASRIQIMNVDYDFFETYGIGLAAGRPFSADLSSDAVGTKLTGLVLNRSAVRALGLTAEEAVGTEIELIGTDLIGSVAGVTDDLYFESARLGERPLVFILAPPQVPGSPWAIRDASIRIAADNVDAALAHIDATWTAFNPAQPLNLHFLQEDFDALYLDDKRQGELLTVFASIAIAIACFGLFGLASFNAERRTKEIGVRKVMGSSVWKIVLLLTNDFSRLVLLSNLIAWPIAYVAMQRWLADFVYHIDLTLIVFIGSGAIALCIAWATVGSIAAKAASQKPVLALRYE